MHWMYYALAAAVALAAADLFVKLAAGEIPDSLGMLLYGSVPFLTGAVWFLVDRSRAGAVTAGSVRGIAYGLGVGIMFATVTFCMYAAFRREAPISLASPLIRLGGLVLAAVAGVVLWKEPFTLRYAAGAALVCAGMYLIMTR